MLMYTLFFFEESELNVSLLPYIGMRIGQLSLSKTYKYTFC